MICGQTWLIYDNTKLDLAGADNRPHTIRALEMAISREPFKGWETSAVYGENFIP